jgi:hypothetical protein
MSRTLVQVIAQVAVFLEFADESVLNLDAAVKQQEDMAFQLQQLGPADRREFTRLLSEVADEWPSACGRDYLRALPGAFGLSWLSAGSLPGMDCEQSSRRGASFSRRVQGGGSWPAGAACPTPQPQALHQPTRLLNRARSARLVHGRLRWLCRLPVAAW